jgi:hypothetical protein
MFGNLKKLFGIEKQEAKVRAEAKADAEWKLFDMKLKKEINRSCTPFAGVRREHNRHINAIAAESRRRNRR